MKVLNRISTAIMGVALMALMFTYVTYASQKTTDVKKVNAAASEPASWAANFYYEGVLYDQK